MEESQETKDDVEDLLLDDGDGELFPGVFSDSYINSILNGMDEAGLGIKLDRDCLSGEVTALDDEPPISGENIIEDDNMVLREGSWSLADGTCLPKEEDQETSEIDCLIYISDRKVGEPAPVDSSRSLLTLPTGLKLQQSQTIGTEGRPTGVFTTAFLPNGIGFGPMEGETVPNLPQNSGCCWKVYRGEIVDHYIDSDNLKFANWMRYVQPVPIGETCNMHIIQYSHLIFFKTVADIPAGTELLLNYRHYRMFNTVKNIPFICHICEKELSSKGNLAAHVASHKGILPYTCSVCKKGFSRFHVLQRHETIHQEGTEKCKFCEKKFTQKHSLVIHMRIHTNEKPYSCDYCDHRCRTLSQLGYHLNSHTKEKTYACENCDKVYSRQANLKDHILAKHKKEKNFQCPECKFNFSRKHHLLRHLLIHQRVKRHKCSSCSETFVRKDGLLAHKKKFHNDSEEVQAECEGVGEVQAECEGLGEVQQRDKPNKCSKCKKAFSRKSALLSHHKLCYESSESESESESQTEDKTVSEDGSESETSEESDSNMDE